MLNSRILSTHASLPQPYPPKQQYDGSKEAQPRLPPHTRTLSHPQHAVHRALEAISRVLKLIVHLLSQRGRVTDFVANKVRQLHSPKAISSVRKTTTTGTMRTYVFQLLNLTRQHAHMFILILTLQLIEHSGRVLAP
jgi:hypothetical protein